MSVLDLVLEAPVASRERAASGGPGEAEGREGEVGLTILMPCLNEIETIETCIGKAQSFLERAGIRGEVLIADNGSTDGSIEAARAMGARVVHVSEKGYGSALRGGIEAARGTYTIMGDADDSYDFANLEKFVAALRDGADLVMGNRFAGGIEPGAMPFLHYYLGNPVLSYIGRLFFSIPVHDFHCGLRGFRTQAIRDLGLVTTGMEFASEMVVRASLEGLKIAEVPTTLRPDGRSRPPHLRTWRDGWRHLKFLLLYSPKWLFFVPGLTLMGIGAVLAAALFPGPIDVGGFVIDLNTFLVAVLAVVMGVQLVTFGALARYYAVRSGLLPLGPFSSRLLTWCRTDRLLLFALGLAVAGLAAFAVAWSQWWAVDFGELTNPMTPRLVAAGLGILAVALQLAFAAFLFGIFDIPRRDDVAADRP